MKDLPKVYANKISDNLNNAQEIFYSNNFRFTNQNNNVEKKINNIFKSSNHVYKSKVKITMKDGILNSIIVGRTNTEIITMSGELINIKDIIDIEKI